MRFKLYEGRKIIPHTKKEMGRIVKEPDIQVDLDINMSEEEPQSELPDFFKIERSGYALLEIVIKSTKYLDKEIQAYRYSPDTDQINVFPDYFPDLEGIHNDESNGFIGIDYEFEAPFVIAIQDDTKSKLDDIQSMIQSWESSRDLWSLNYNVPFIRGRYGFKSSSPATGYYILDTINYNGIDYNLNITSNDFLRRQHYFGVLLMCEVLTNDVLRKYYSGEIFSNAGIK